MRKTIDELQMLRGFGILAVIAHHSATSLFAWKSPDVNRFLAYFSANAALDMFFVMSGFLIFRLLHSELGKSEDRYHSIQISCIFWLRRAWRLLPAAWLWLVIAMLLVIFANESNAFKGVREAWGGVLSAFLFVANFKFADCFMMYSCGPTFPYWSLSLEEQFYLFLPLLMIFSGKWLLRILLVLLFTQYFVPVLTLPPTFRLQGLLLGVLMGIWSLSPTYRIFEPIFLKDNPWVRRVITGMLVVWMCTMSRHAIPTYMVFQLGALNGAVLIYIASFDSNYLWQDGWLKRLGLWLGDRAYAMYLCHIPLFYLTREFAYHILGPDVPLGPEHFWYLLVGSMSMILVLSHLTFTLLERPLRRRGMVIAADLEKRQELDRAALRAGQANPPA